ncbi:MAG TPA: hypothetical protein VMV44_09805 [Rectinemataceae bacterium]|nr:hypothetical protein [Rectinemataceae bacterium]
MTEVFSSYFQEEALVLKTLLDSAGIGSEILAGSMTELAPFYNINSGGYRLIVSEEDAEDAAALVAEHRRLKAARKETEEGGAGELEP